MGPITALGTESWLINSNSLTNCFFTKNHLSLSHGTHMHENLHSYALPKRKRKKSALDAHPHNCRYTCTQTLITQSPPALTHTHSQAHMPTQMRADPLAQLYLPQGQYVDYVRVADYCTVTVKETNVFHRQASISARGLLAIDYSGK